MKKETILSKFLYSQSYKDEFRELMLHLEDKYGTDFMNISGIGNQLDTNAFAKNFFKTEKNTADLSVDSNSNVSLKNIIVFDEELVKPLKLIYSYYRLWKGLNKRYGIEYANMAIEKQLSGEIYINDFQGFSTNKYYCYNYSTLDTALNGIPKGIDSEESQSTKYLNTFFEHLQLFCVHAGSSSLGAVGLADLLLTVSIYADRILTTQSDQHVNFKTQEDCWTYIKEKLTNFVYFLNQPNRLIQSLFSNVSIYDSEFLDSLIEHYAFEYEDTAYRAKKETVIRIQDIFLDIINEIMSRRLITFPVITACFSLDESREIQDKEFLDKMIKANEKYCIINFYGGKTTSLSSCCRLRSDKTNTYFSTLSGAGTKIGSLGVCTLNLPRLAYLSNGDINEFYKNIEEDTVLAQRINNVKRNILKSAIKKRMIPVYNLGYVLINTQYSTLGINGLYESLEILGHNIATDSGLEFAGDLLDKLNAWNDQIGDELKAPVNLEQIPAENVSVKLSKKDRLLGYNDKYELYSNQFIPLTYTGVGSDLLTKIRIQGALDKKLSGGSILHININETNVPNETFKKIVESTFRSGTIYFAFNKLISICGNCGEVFTSNKVDFDNMYVECPKCESTNVEHALRIVGFIRKFSSYSKERREESSKRKFYNI